MCLLLGGYVPPPIITSSWTYQFIKEFLPWKLYRLNSYLEPLYEEVPFHGDNIFWLIYVTFLSRGIFPWKSHSLTYQSSAIHNIYNIFFTSQIMTENFSAIEPTINISFIYKLHVYNDYDSNAIKHVLHAFRPLNLLRFSMVWILLVTCS